MIYDNGELFEMLCDIGVIKESNEVDTEVLSDCEFYIPTVGCVISDGRGCYNMCKYYNPKED